MTTDDPGPPPSGPRNGAPKPRFSIVPILFILALLVLFQIVFSQSRAGSLTYSEFKTLLAAGKVRDVLVGQRTVSGQFLLDSLAGLLPAARIAELRKSAVGATGSPQPFVAVRVEDPALVGALEAAKVQFAGQLESPWVARVLIWVLPGLFLFWLVGRGMRRLGTQGGLMAIGKSKAKVYMERTTGVTFQDVAGIDEAVRS